LLTGDYLLDLFWADSPRERTYDWFVHPLGRLSLPPPHGFQPSQDLLRPYHWVDRERKWETDRTWSADFVQQGKVKARGAWRSFRVAAPDAASSGALTINGREAPYRKKGGYILFNDSSEPPRTNPPRVTAAATPVSAPEEFRVPPSTGVTIQEADRHPLFPMWVVRAPGYEMQIHRKFGVSRTLIDGHGQLLWGSQWWGGSGVFEVRLPTGAEKTAPFAWSHPAKEIRWQGPTMEVTAPSGESFTATFGEHAIRYAFHGKPDIEYRASIQSFFWHATGRLRTAKDEPLAGLPSTFDDFHWTCLQNPGLSPGCVLLLTPRQPAEWSHRPANISAYWPLRDGEKFLLVFGTEDRLRSLAEEAIRAP
jgi:hypothetical protein